MALESGCLSHWLIEELRKQHVPAICVDSRHMAAVLATTINKTDKNDARGIANALRCNMYREVHAKTSMSIEKCTLLASRRAIVEQKTHITNTIRGLLKAYGIRISLSATTNMFFEYVKAKIVELSELARYGLEELLKTAELLHNQTKAFDKMIKSLPNKMKKPNGYKQKRGQAQYRSLKLSTIKTIERLER